MNERLIVELERHLGALRTGDHLGFLYEDATQRVAILAPLFQAGLTQGERCIYVPEDGGEEGIVDALRTGLGVPAVDGGPLLVVAGSRLGPLGAKDAGEMLSAMEREAAAAGYAAVRVAIEMTWALGPLPPPRRLIEWETGLHRYLTPVSRALVICHYDRRRFPPSALEVALRSHPTVILGGYVYANSYYTPNLPDALRGVDESPVPALSPDRREAPPPPRGARVLSEQLAQEDADASERRAAFLAEASVVFASSLDLDTTVERITHLAVPALADWCVVVVVDGDGTVRPVAAAQFDPGQVRLAYELSGRYPIRLDAPSHPLAEAIRTGRSRLVAEVSTDLLLAEPRDSEHLGILQGMGVTSLMIVPLQTGGRVLGALAFATVESGRRYSGDDLGLAEALGRRAAVAVSNAQFYAASERRRREAEGLADLGRLISGSLEPAEVARRIAESVRILLRGRSASLLRLGPQGDLHVTAVSGNSPTDVPDLVIPRGVGTVGLAVLERRPVATSDVLSDPRFQIPPEVGARIGSDAHGAVLAVPLIVKDHVTGVLRVTDSRGRIFDQDEIRLAQAFADQAAIAQENSRLYAQAEELAAERERVRVAHELHDALSQVLFSIGLKLDWCLRRLHQRSPIRDRLDEIRREAGFVMEQIRQLIGKLSPGEDDRFFPDGLQAMVGHFHDLTGIAVEVQAQGDLSRLDAHDQQLLRKVLQEALTNIAKHSRAARATVAVAVRPDEVAFEVVDDGVGPPAELPDTPPSLEGHFGLRQMRERLEAVGGRLEYGRHGPAGFRLAGAFGVGR